MSEANYEYVQHKSLRKLVKLLQDYGADSLEAVANGSGDEGFVQEVYVSDVLRESLDTDTIEGLYDLLVDVFAEHGFNYSDGDGGQVELSVSLSEGVVKWEDACYSNELIDMGGEVISLADYSSQRTSEEDE